MTRRQREKKLAKARRIAARCAEIGYKPAMWVRHLLRQAAKSKAA